MIAQNRNGTCPDPSVCVPGIGIRYGLSAPLDYAVCPELPAVVEQGTGHLFLVMKQVTRPLFQFWRFGYRPSFSARRRSYAITAMAPAPRARPAAPDPAPMTIGEGCSCGFSALGRLATASGVR